MLVQRSMRQNAVEVVDESARMRARRSQSIVPGTMPAARDRDDAAAMPHRLPTIDDAESTSW